MDEPLRRPVAEIGTLVGRPAQVTEQDLFAAVGRLVASDGPSALSTRKIAAEAGIPTGSLYHRFSNRDSLIASAWLEAVSTFQQGFVIALDNPELDAAVAGAAAHTPTWASEHPVETAMLMRYSREELLQHWPGELADTLESVNRPVIQALRRHARRRWRVASAQHVDLLRFAVITVPRASVRDHPDPSVLVEATAAAALAIVRTLP